ncbi:MAG: adenosylcobinamide-GDP ribazoletransferase [Candidatus Omnitrophota bacterium]
MPGRTSARIPDDAAKSLLYFPLVGAIIGAILCLITFVIGTLPSFVIAAILLAASFILTGGIHIDGFADTCDGLCSGKPRDAILNIMRDSNTGALGAACLVIMLLLKFSIIAGTPIDHLWKSLLLMATFSRWSQALSCVTSKYARQDGKAKLFITNAKPKDVIFGGLLTLSLFYWLSGLTGIAVFTLSLVSAVLSIFYIKNKIGGMTGDTIGAVNEISENSVLLFSLILIK